jgi:hypothetical protein
MEPLVLSMRMNNLVPCVVVLPGRQHKCTILCRLAGRRQVRFQGFQESSFTCICSWYVKLYQRCLFLLLDDHT